MRYKLHNPFLRNEAAEMADGGGAATPAAAVSPEAAAPSVSAPPAAAAAPPREPTILEKVQAAVRDKGSILAENTDLKKQVSAHLSTITAREETIGTLQARVKELETENSQLQQDFDSIDAALKTTEAKVVSIDSAAAKQVAGMAFEPEKLPAAEKEGESIEAMEARLGQETDPQKIVTLARQIDAKKAAMAAAS